MGAEARQGVEWHRVGMTPDNQNPPPDGGRITSLISAVKGLTFANVAIIGLLAIIAVPVYIVYRAFNDEELLDRFFSNYREYSSQNVGCTLRSAQFRGSGEVWAISTGIAFQGADRYLIAVTLDHHPSDEEVNSYCETIKTIADKLQERS
jgi:hypothetical protein